ncbi:MAG: acyltransferase [Oscillospiraceae bacterium]|nr:acyltransferase [Oscillospiraceae bacterium]
MKSMILKFLKKTRLIGKKDEIEAYRKNGVKIGENCKFYNVNLDNGHGYLIEIGDDCTLTNCIVLSHDASTKYYFGKSKVGKVKIGNRCFIGMQSIILPNINIGDDCIIGAGTIVTKNIPSNSVVAGNPAKIIMSTAEFKKKHAIYMKEKPVFNTYWKYKTEKDKMKEKELLKDTFGYDE